jgi:hypothetical protein
VACRLLISSFSFATVSLRDTKTSSPSLAGLAVGIISSRPEGEILKPGGEPSVIFTVLQIAVDDKYEVCLYCCLCSWSTPHGQMHHDSRLLSNFEMNHKRSVNSPLRAFFGPPSIRPPDSLLSSSSFHAVPRKGLSSEIGPLVHSTTTTDADRRRFGRHCDHGSQHRSVIRMHFRISLLYTHY